MRYRHFPVALLTLLLLACSGENAPEPAAAGAVHGKPQIIASNYPLYFFAREIAGDSAHVTFPSMEGDPANWKPGGEAIAQMQSADLVILNGAAYEPWLGWVSLPDDILLDTSAEIGDRLIPLSDETIHQHGPQGDHSHQGTAFTIWLDPMLAMELASAIEKAISKLVPDKQQAHQAALEGLRSRLEMLDEALQTSFETLDDQPLVFSHPVYQYLSARYGLDGVSMHWEPDQEPGIKSWIDFQEILQNHPAKLMLWEDQPVAATAAQLERRGVRPIPFHTASNRPVAGDYFDVMYANVERLRSH